MCAVAFSARRNVWRACILESLWTRTLSRRSTRAPPLNGREQEGFYLLVSHSSKFMYSRGSMACPLRECFDLTASCQVSLALIGNSWQPYQSTSNHVLATVSSAYKLRTVPVLHGEGFNSPGLSQVVGFFLFWADHRHFGSPSEARSWILFLSCYILEVRRGLKQGTGGSTFLYPVQGYPTGVIHFGSKIQACRFMSSGGLFFCGVPKRLHVGHPSFWF